MLEWLKTILGDSYTEDIDKQISAEIGKGFVARADFNAKNEELKTANGTIATLQDAAKQYDGVDVDGLKQELANAKTDYENKLKALRRDSAIDLALVNSKARSGKAVRALLDLDKVGFDDQGNLTGLDDQLTALKKTDAWLFDTGAVVNTGGEHGAGGTAEIDGVEAAFAKLNPGLKL